MEEYSEGKIHKSDPDYQGTKNTRIGRMEFVYAMNEHEIANVYSVMFELPSKNVHKKYTFTN